MNKIKKVVLLTLGGACGGMVGGVFAGMIGFLVYFNEPCPGRVGIMLEGLLSSSVFSTLGGVIIGLGVSLGAILIPDKYRILKSTSQIIITGFIMSVFVFRWCALASLTYYGHIYTALNVSYCAAIASGIASFGITIGKNLAERKKLFWPRVLTGTLVNILVVLTIASLYFCLFPTHIRMLTLILITYIPSTGGIGFGIILFSSLFKFNV